MIDAQVIRRNITNTIKETQFDTLGEKYTGKVRDNYTDRENARRVIIATDRISAFDVVLGTLQFKGQILNQMAAFWFEQTADVAKSHFIKSPDPNIMIAKLCTPFPVEVVVRNYLTGSLWREYEKGIDAYELGLATKMRKDEKFEKPIITPSTKAESGHDLPMTRQDVLKLIPEEKYRQMEQTALRLFARASQIAAKRGLILVDTKYEFGLSSDGEILLIDEIHTPDSARYWMAHEYEQRFAAGQSQQMLDKEYVRQWLISKGFMGNGEPPPLHEDIVVSAVQRYAEAYEMITGAQFEPVEGDVHERMRKNLIKEGYSV